MTTCVGSAVGLASAAAVTNAGNSIFMEGDGGYISNNTSGEKIPLRKKGGTYVFEVEWVEDDAPVPFARPE